MRRSGAVFIGVISALALAAPAQAATFNVNSTADEPDADTGAPACATADGACTLRAAVDQANADDSDSVINLPAGVYTLTGAPADEDNESGDLDVSSGGFTVAINGAGARTTVINGAGVDRVLDVAGNSKLTVRGVTITGGNTDVMEDLFDSELDPELLFNVFGAIVAGELSDGGGIYVTGPSEDDGEEQVPSELVVIDSTITGNRAGNVFDFASNVPEDELDDAFEALSEILGEELAALILFGNLTFGDGGGIHAGEGTQLSVTGSTIAGNAAEDDGGGIETDAAGASVLNSTIHGNIASGGSDGDGDGGGIEQNQGVLSVVHATISGNTAADKGGGVNLEQEECADNFLFCLLREIIVPVEGRRRLGVSPAQQQEEPPAPGSAGFRSTILSSNQAPDEGPNCRADDASTLTSAGTNLEGGTDCGFTAAGNLQSSDPQLGPLANNGGQTDTRALGPASPALHAASSNPCPPTDQRGTVRPQGPECDIGAYERVLQADLEVTVTDSPDPVSAGGNVTYSIVARNAGPDPATNARVTFDVPVGTELQSSTLEGGGSCTGTSTLTCDLGNMAVGQTRRVTVIVRTQAGDARSSATQTARAAQAGGTIEARARIDATETDPVTANNEDQAITSLERAEEEDDAGPGGGDGGGVANAGVSGDDGALAFTGLPIAILIAAGAWMLGAGLTLRLFLRPSSGG